jgi:DNA-binding transcriptional ArsR family regulator
MDKRIKDVEKILKALANARRLAIVKFLRDSKTKELTVGDISTSRHLSILSSANIIVNEQRSLYVYYRLNPAQRKVSRDIITIL